MNVVGLEHRGTAQAARIPSPHVNYALPVLKLAGNFQEWFEHDHQAQFFEKLTGTVALAIPDKDAWGAAEVGVSVANPSEISSVPPVDLLKYEAR